jgi:SAM-dependent methyltransferase
MSSDTTTDSATVQGRLWSVRADDWAEIQERQVLPAYKAAFDALGVDHGTRLLDIGCGAGLALRLAADRGAAVSGLDASEGLLAHTRQRVPGAPVVLGDLERLPFDDDSFDVATGFNSFQFAAQPVVALVEAKRVIAPGGHVLVMVWAPAEQCEAAAYLAALGRLMPPPPPGAAGPFALSGEDALTELLDSAGLDVTTITDVTCEWRYPDERTAVAGLMCSGPVVGVAEHAGEDAVREVTRGFLESFRTVDGGYRLTNDFRYAISTPRR